MNEPGDGGYKTQIPRVMFAYACVTAAAAGLWMAWAFLNGGFTIPKGSGLIGAAIFLVYMGPFAMPVSPPKRGWVPLLRFWRGPNHRRAAPIVADLHRHLAVALGGESLWRSALIHPGLTGHGPIRRHV